MPGLSDLVKDVEIKDTGRMFGLAGHVWNERLDLLQPITGPMSEAASFPMQTWRDIGGFDSFLGSSVQADLFHHAVQNRKWILWMNNTPIIHLRSSDTGSLTAADKTTFYQLLNQSDATVSKKYGWDWEAEHVFLTYFAETSIIYYDEIINAVNELRFSDIDYIFDEFSNRLKNKKLANCELLWCQLRPACKYV